jgi:hypothetical protein
MKPSRASSRVKCLYETDVSKTISVVVVVVVVVIVIIIIIIIRVLIYRSDDDPDSFRNVGFIQTPEAADSPTRIRLINSYFSSTSTSETTSS